MCRHPHSPFQCWKIVKCKFSLDQSVLSTLQDQYQYLGNCASAPPLTQHVIAAAASEPQANERGSSLISRRLHYRDL